MAQEVDTYKNPSDPSIEEAPFNYQFFEIEKAITRLARTQYHPDVKNIQQQQQINNNTNQNHQRQRTQRRNQQHQQRQQSMQASSFQQHLSSQYQNLDLQSQDRMQPPSNNMQYSQNIPQMQTSFQQLLQQQQQQPHQQQLLQHYQQQPQPQSQAYQDQMNQISSSLFQTQVESIIRAATPLSQSATPPPQPSSQTDVTFLNTNQGIHTHNFQQQQPGPSQTFIQPPLLSRSNTPGSSSLLYSYNPSQLQSQTSAPQPLQQPQSQQSISNRSPIWGTSSINLGNERPMTPSSEASGVSSGDFVLSGMSNSHGSNGGDSLFWSKVW